MRSTIQTRSNPVASSVIHASRQVWLAYLGAAVVTRDWAQSEAGAVFRTLVKEGTLVEARTIRMVGDRIEDSFAKANTLWQQARSTVQSTVKQAADTAVTLVQTNLPKAFPNVALPAMLSGATPARVKRRTRVAKAKRVTRARSERVIKRAKKAAAKK